jgi:membrane associated rhomboid family serine protease
MADDLRVRRDRGSLRRAVRRPRDPDRARTSPAGLSGDWWRSFTALFVQDGGLAGTLFNLAFLLVIGSIAEQVFDRRRWLLLYFIPGLAGEFVATVGHGGTWAAVAIFAVGITALDRMRQRGWPAGPIVAAAGLAEAVVLMALANIHGAALAAAVALAAVLILLIP